MLVFKKASKLNIQTIVQIITGENAYKVIKIALVSINGYQVLMISSIKTVKKQVSENEIKNLYFESFDLDKIIGIKICM